MNRYRTRHRAATFALGLLIGGLTLTASAAPSPSKGLQRLSLRDNPARVRVAVELDVDSVGAFNIKTMKASGALANRGEQQAQAARVVAQQREFSKQLDSLGEVQHISALRISANALIVNIGNDKLDALKSLPGVRNVTRVMPVHLDNSDSVPWIGAPQVWEQHHIKGEHVKIGILDTGIDYTHKNFGGSGDPAQYRSIDPNVLTPGTFPTAKVKGGTDLVGALYDFDNDPTAMPHPDNNPIDVQGHGSHVAGTAAGFGVPGKIGPGVAPEALLYSVKVFDDLGNSSSQDIIAQAIEWAVDPDGDGDTSDHLDVINMSLGDVFGSSNSIQSITAQRATELGVIVVAASGNQDRVPYITEAPANAPGAISVAATTKGGILLSRTTVTAPPGLAGVKASVEGVGPVQLNAVPAISATVVPSDPAIGCDPYTNASAVAGNIALVRRGICDFTVKYLQAQAAGARAIVVYNDGADASRVDPFTMGVIDPRIKIPGLMISSTDGFAIAAAAATPANPVRMTLDVGLDPSRDDQTTVFTSRGPGSGGTQFKPDISAPGLSIVSTAVGTGTEGKVLNGTSMATPHVAGSAALLHQLHPDFAPADIKAILQNSTVGANASSDTDVARQGVGVLRVNRAAELTAVATPAGLSFGRLNPVSPIVRTQPFVLHDFGGHSRTFTVKHVPHRSYPGVTVACPSSITVGANQARVVRLTLSFDPSVAPAQGVTDDGLQSQTEVDGWFELSDGKDTLRIAYLAAVDAASQLSTRSSSTGLTVTNEGPSAGLAQGFTLTGLRENSSAPVTETTITHVGVRRASASGTNTVEFAVALGKIFENISARTFELFLDFDGDGVDDMELDGADISAFPALQRPPGTFVTAQFDLKTGEGFVDNLAVSDFNDRVVILPFTAASSGGLVPTKFNYRLRVTSHLSTDAPETLTGAVDLEKEVVPNLNDFTLEPHKSAEVQVARSGKMLWFYTQNPEQRQVEVAVVTGSANP